MPNKKPLYDESKGDSIWVVSTFEGLEYVSIKTFSVFICQTLEFVDNLNKEERRNYYSKRLTYLLGFRGHVADIYKTPEWREFSNMFVEYYCARAIIYKIDMPLKLNIDESNII